MSEHQKYLKYCYKNNQFGNGILCKLCKLRLNDNDIPFQQNKFKKYQIYIKNFNAVGLNYEKINISKHELDFYEKGSKDQINIKIEKKLLSIPNDSILLCPTYHCECCKIPIEFQVSLSGKIEKKDNYHNIKLKKKYNEIKKKLSNDYKLYSFQNFCLVKNCVKREILEETGLKIDNKSLYESILECFKNNFIFEGKIFTYYFLFINIDNTKYRSIHKTKKQILPDHCKAIFKYQEQQEEEQEQKGGKKQVDKNIYFDSDPSKIRINVILYFTDNHKIDNFIFRSQFRYLTSKDPEYFDLLSAGLLNKKSFLNLLDIDSQNIPNVYQEPNEDVSTHIKNIRNLIIKKSSSDK
jgi:8-oxo-dGTP pyrophosphatase MutT (NUDIX family)